MSISIRWDDAEKSVLMLIFKGRWTGQEFDGTVEQALNMLNSTDKAVTAIMDFRFIAWFIPDLSLSVLHLLNVLLPHIQEGVVLGLNPVLFSTLSRIHHTRSQTNVRCATSLREAYEFVAQAKRHMPEAQPQYSEQESCSQSELHLMLRSFESAQSFRLTSFKGNGRPVITIVPFVLETESFYILTSRGSEEAQRIQNNPHVNIDKIETCFDKTLPYPVNVQLQAIASLVTLQDRSTLITIWEQKYHVKVAVAKLYSSLPELVWLEVIPSFF